MSSLRTSLNAEDFAPPALGDETEGSQPSEQNQEARGQQHSGEQDQQKPHEDYIPYNRFQEVAHDNQNLRAQIQQYEQRLQQVQQQQYQQQAQPSRGIGGMQSPDAMSQAQQQVANALDAELQDPIKVREWRRRIAEEGPVALREFMTRTIEEEGRRMLQEALQPVLQKVSLIEGDRVANTINNYATSVQDPEFQNYRHIFEQAVRQVAPQYNIADRQTLDTIRYFAQAQYRAQAGQQQQMQQAGYYPPQPPVTERPGSNFSQGQQPVPRTGRFQNVDQRMAEMFKLDPDAIAKARARTVRGG